MLKNLEDWLAEGFWIERFEEEVKGLGGRLVSKVKTLRLDEGDGEICFSAEVSGAGVDGAFWEEGGGFGFETTCSCDVGALCEHGFAVVGRLAKEKNLGKFFGRTAREAVAVELKRKDRETEATADKAPDPVFDLVIRRGKVDRPTKLLIAIVG